MKKVKSQLSVILNCDKDFKAEEFDQISVFNGIPVPILKKLNLDQLGNPTEHARKVHEAINGSIILVSLFF